jgi:RND family efflux transporter MFP subunit
MKSKSFRIVVAILLLFLGWQIIKLVTKTQEDQNTKSGRPAIAVEVDSVRFGPLAEIRQFTGNIHPLYQYIVSPKVSGRLLTIKKRIGDWVRTGEVIALIDDAEYQQSVREAEANLKIAKASLVEANSQFVLASQELERSQSLQKKGIASPAELDAANTSYTAQQSRLELAHAQVEQREAALKSAQIRLGYTTLAATQPGFVGERYVDEGTLLSANSPVVSVVGLDRVIILTTVIERDYGRMQVGQDARVVADAFPGQEYLGRVARIAPVLDQASRMAKMEIEVENAQRVLKPGMFVQVRVVLAAKERTQIVLSRAVLHKNGNMCLFVIRANEPKAQLVIVKTGIVNGDFTEILEPAVQGQVVVLGQHLLEDGSPVLLPKASVSRTSGAKAGTGKESKP